MPCHLIWSANYPGDNNEGGESSDSDDEFEEVNDSDPRVLSAMASEAALLGIDKDAPIR